MGYDSWVVSIVHDSSGEFREQILATFAAGTGNSNCRWFSLRILSVDFHILPQYVWGIGFFGQYQQVKKKPPVLPSFGTWN